VCQNQTIADSNADLAADLRNQVREKVRQGQSDAEIMESWSRATATSCSTVRR